jgi:branched-chain amino acid aminotransferase
MEPFCYLNGKIIPLSQASVGLYDIGLLRGFGIYEGLRSANRKPFAFAEHMERFRRSADYTQLKIPVADADIDTAMRELIDKNVPVGREGLIRMILTGGRAVGGISFDPETPTLFILVETYEPPEKRFFAEGCSIVTYEHMRQFPGFKTTNYIQAVLLQKLKKETGALEIAYVFGGKMLEATGSNFFIVKGGTVATPKDNILHGITRKIVLQTAGPEFSIEERDVSVDEMFAADEMFLTSSFKDVVPVTRVDDRMIGRGKPGAVTERVIELFAEYVGAY